MAPPRTRLAGPLFASWLALAGCAPAPTPTPEPTPVAVAEPTPPPPLPPLTVADDPAWTLLAAESGSTLRFAAIKNGEARVEGTFRRVLGGLSMDPAAPAGATGTLTVDLGSLDSGLPPRDWNIATAFFGAPSGGVITLRGLRLDGALAVGGSVVGEASLGLDLGLGAIELPAKIRLDRPEADRYAATLAEPVSVSIAALGLDGRKAALIQLCQHQSIADAVEISGGIELRGRPVAAP